jgi:hypothetical protein
LNEADGGDEDDHRGSSDDGNAFLDAESGHDNLERANLMVAITTAADRDDSNDDDDLITLYSGPWHHNLPSKSDATNQFYMTSTQCHSSSHMHPTPDFYLIKRGAPITVRMPPLGKVRSDYNAALTG